MFSGSNAHKLIKEEFIQRIDREKLKELCEKIIETSKLKEKLADD